MTLKQYIDERGVGFYFALVFSSLSILLTLVLVEVIGVSASSEVKSNIGHGLAELALQTSDKLDRGMYERYREVRLMAQRKDLTSPQTSTEDKRKVLDDRKETYSFYAWIGMTDPEGKVVAATQGMLEGADVSARPWFHNALNGNFLGDVHEAKLLARLLPATDGAPKRFVDIAFPYHSSKDGTLLGVLGVHLSWQWAREVEQSIIEPIAARLNVESLIVGADGTVLLGPPGLQGSVISLGKLNADSPRGSGYTVATWADGRKYLIGFSRSKGYANYPGLGWTVLVRQELDEAYLPVRRIQRRVLWSGIGLAALFSLLGLYVARQISRPLARLAESSELIQQGEAFAIIPDDSYREVKTLTGSLNALVTNLLQKESDLRELNQTLESRVARRTRELEHALAAVQASERRIHTIVDTAQDAFVGLDLHGNVTDWNVQAEKTFGWTRDEAYGRPLSELVLPERFRESYLQALRNFHETGRIELLNQRVERIVVNRDGVEFPVEVTTGLAGTSETYFFSAFLHDISERKKVERMKNEFISTVSHELRTPLTSIRASLSMLADGMAGDLPEDTRGLIDIAYRSCERLVRLVNDMLDIEKIESGNMEFNIRRQPLRPLLEQALAAIAGYARQYGVTLELQDETGGIDGGIDVDVDADRMTQVLDNLLSNAIKFSPPGETVVLRVAAKDGHLRLSVIDHGAGIPEAFRTRIFQKFAQADATDSRQKGGTGLGLSICKSIVEEHGGTIDYDSETGRGTCFHVDLPLPGKRAG